MSGTYTPVQGLILLAYNAYYNRFLKYEASLQDYLDNSEGSDYLIQNVNFNPADGLNTIHIAGNGELDNRLEFRDYSFTYALLIEYNPANKTREEIYADEDTHILSKWFILDNDRTRGGQYRLSLRRDVLVDYMKQIKKSPIFVERGILSEISPITSNNEDTRVNQIKKDEILLKDQSLCPWLVIYLKKGVLGNAGISPITVKIEQNEDFVYKTLTTPINQWEFWQYTQEGYNYRHTKYFDFRVHYQWPAYTARIFKMANYSPYPYSDNYTSWPQGNLECPKRDWDPDRLGEAMITKMPLMSNTAISVFNFNMNDPISEYNGKIIKDSDNKFFLVRVSYPAEDSETRKITSSNAPAIKSDLTDAWRTSTGKTTDNPDNNAFEIRNFYKDIHIDLIPQPEFETTIDVSTYTGKGTTDSPLFDAICMPYGSLNIYGSGGLIDIDTEAQRSMDIMNSIATALTSEYVLDFQLLPFCPCQNLLRSNDHKVHISYKTDTCIDCTYGGSTTDLIIVCEKANFTFDIFENITADVEFDEVPEAFKSKFVNDCVLLRLCSPNYNGLFEFNLAKNGGEISKFNVDMTLKPFNPYIHVNPNFDFLYGSDFNDQRGLICGGDFSLGIINDAWNVYEIQNKNYQAIFDRQIQNLDKNNAIARQEAGWGIAAGVLSGAAAGAAGGAIVGGGWGALAGGIIGAGTSAVGGVLDWQNLEKRQAEQRSYAIDNYHLMLGNVQALPYSITKTSALTFNNKLFVFVEIYECSNEEKEAYYNKLYWNGMTIGIIDRIEKYMSNNWANYFRGKLIALYGEEGSNAVENRIIEAINMELMKGVFI